MTSYPINDSASCIDCDSLGRPIGVEEEDEKERYTVYSCASCSAKWYRPH